MAKNRQAASSTIRGSIDCCRYVELKNKTQFSDGTATPFSPECQAYVYESDSDSESIEWLRVDQETNNSQNEKSIKILSYSVYKGTRNLIARIIK